MLRPWVLLLATMVAGLGKVFGTRRLAIALGAAALLLGGRGDVRAGPILGGQLYYTGGDVDITVLASTADYDSDLYLYPFYPSLVSPRFIANNHADLGETVHLSASFFASNGITVGEELVFGIRVLDTGDTFFIGPGNRNPDRLMHNVLNVVSTTPFIADVGFEDIYGGGDRDYDDNVFRFRGAVAVTPVPEPASMALLGVGGLGLLGYARRKRRAAAPA